MADRSSLDVNGDLMVLEDLDNAQGMARPCSAPTTRAQSASRARGACRLAITETDYPPTREPGGHRGRMGLRVDHARRLRDDGDYENDEALGRDG